ncbi:hypothetical protein ACFL4J_01615 [Candidatus Margulisiibacteriota bacterium]
MADYLQGVQGVQGTQGVLSAEMLERANRATTPSQRAQVRDEFLAIFYKALLKQAITPAQLGFSEDNNPVISTFGSDLMVERMALELARSKSFSADDLFPPVMEGNAQDR